MKRGRNIQQCEGRKADCAGVDFTCVCILLFSVSSEAKLEVSLNLGWGGGGAQPPITTITHKQGLK